METSEGTGDSLPTPGQILREARERAGISPREMADRLNWMPGNVAAVEEDRFDSLRGDAFVRGYLRAYAKVVDVDEDRLIATYEAMLPEGSDPEQRSESSGAKANGETTGNAVVIGLVVAVVLVLGYWWWQTDQGADRVVKAERPSPAAVAESTPEPSTQLREDAPAAIAREESSTAREESSTASEPEAIEPAAPVAAAAAVPAEPIVDADAALATAVETAAAPAEALPATEDPQAEQGLEDSAAGLVELAADAVPGEGEAELGFSFSGDCWLEVRDGDEQLIYADLRAAGDEIRLSGVPPFRILAGDAAVVRVFYQGEEVPVRTRPGRDTARFTVGEPLGQAQEL